MAQHAANWQDFFEVASLTDIGLRRSNNQDSHSVVPAASELDWYRRGHMFIVADGMGAHAAGELASKLACNDVPHIYYKLADMAAPPALRQAIVETNANIHGRGKANAEFHGMGTTCSVLTLLPQGAVVGHVGDSRIYRWRRNRIEQLTFDHSLIWEMRATGQLANEGDAPSYIPKNIITRSLGPHPEVKADLEGPFPMEVGDTFLVCCDGLSGQLSDEEIGLLLGALSPQEAVKALVSMANWRGGPDNITVIVVRVRNPVQLTDASVPARAAETGQGGGTAAIHPALWVTMGVGILGAAGMALSGNMIPAGACGVLAALSGLAALVQGLSRGESIDGAWANTRLGGGPYVAYDCTPTAASIASLAQLCDKLKDVARDDKFAAAAAEFHRALEQASRALAAGKFTAAVREYAVGQSSLWEKIRRKRSETGGSVIES